jgi:gamma-glutamylaminecyclotransferase
LTSKSKITTTIFVYGTLKNGFYWHDKYLADKSNFLGPAVTSKEYSLYIDGLPHMVFEESDTGVKGELYEVDTEVLAAIDDLESHPMVYRREIIETFKEDGTPVKAWAYLRPKSFKGKNAWKEFEFL